MENMLRDFQHELRCQFSDRTRNLKVWGSSKPEIVLSQVK